MLFHFLLTTALFLWSPLFSQQAFYWHDYKVTDYKLTKLLRHSRNFSKIVRKKPTVLRKLQHITGRKYLSTHNTKHLSIYPVTHPPSKKTLQHRFIYSMYSSNTIVILLLLKHLKFYIVYHNTWHFSLCYWICKTCTGFLCLA